MVSLKKGGIHYFVGGKEQLKEWLPLLISLGELGML